jgi:hypothetical protein
VTGDTPIGGMSAEVVKHHEALHRRRCPDTSACALVCEHGTTTAIMCVCGQPVYLVVEGGTWCADATEVERGVALSGHWRLHPAEVEQFEQWRRAS